MQGSSPLNLAHRHHLHAPICPIATPPLHVFSQPTASRGDAPGTSGSGASLRELWFTPSMRTVLPCKALSWRWLPRQAPARLSRLPLGVSSTRQAEALPLRRRLRGRAGAEVKAEHVRRARGGAVRGEGEERTGQRAQGGEVAAFGVAHLVQKVLGPVAVLGRSEAAAGERAKRRENQGYQGLPTHRECPE